MVQHTSFLKVDKLAPLCTKMFLDINIAKNMKCCRANATCIWNQVMGPLLRSELVGYMKNNII